MFRELILLWKHPAVSKYKKYLFAIITLGYWLIPVDFLPFLPFDDILISILTAAWFIYSAHKDLQNGNDKKTIDADAEIID